MIKTISNRRRTLVYYWLLLLAACAADVVLPPPENSVTVTAKSETVPVSSSDDAADDPVVWLHRAEPENSLIIGTDKRLGLESYSLEGQRVQRLALGRTNNVDLRPIDGHRQWSALAAASNRSTNTVSLVLIDHEGQMHWLPENEIDTGLSEPYGLCMYKSVAGLQVFVNDTDGRYQQWLLALELGDQAASSSVSAELVRSFTVQSQPEGCTADDRFERLFVGVEEAGVYWLSARHTDSSDLRLLAAVDSSILAADVEGMDLYLEGSTGYLVVSSQGSYSYSIYDRQPPFNYRGSFQIADGPNSDGAEETDGLALHSGLRTEHFPDGILVVQDGSNFDSESGNPINQNFKLVNWRELSSVLNLE